MTHRCINKLTIFGSDKGLSLGGRQAIIWTNSGILLIGILVTNFSEMLIHTFSFKKMHLKMLHGKWWPFCLGLNVLTVFSVFKWCIYLYSPRFLHWHRGNTMSSFGLISLFLYHISLQSFTWASFGLQILSLPASVCLCVCMCGNHVLVHMIAHHLFKLGSPNLDHRCKRPWLRSLLFCGVIDHDL